MKAWVKRLYDLAPAGVQSALVSVFSAHLERSRYGGRFPEFQALLEESQWWDAERIGRVGVTPNDRVMPRRAAAPLQQPALDWKARIVVVEERHHLANAVRVEQLRVDSVDAHGIAAPGIGIALRVGMVEVQHAALADHGVVVEVALHRLPELHRQLVEADIARQQEKANQVDVQE